jgi:hypothetical protein
MSNVFRKTGLLLSVVFILALSNSLVAQTPPLPPNCCLYNDSWDADLTVGQNNRVGRVYICTDGAYLWVILTLEPGSPYNIIESAVEVSLYPLGNPLCTVPINPKGTPIPGHFASKMTSTHMHMFKLSDLGASVGDDVYIFAHAVVLGDFDGDGYLDEETGWGEGCENYNFGYNGLEFPGPRWGYYFWWRVLPCS